nr:protein PHOX1-like [Ipomoea batatas]
MSKDGRRIDFGTKMVEELIFEHRRELKFFGMKAMGKPLGRKNSCVLSRSNNESFKLGKAVVERSYSCKAFDEDTAVFINMSQELKEEGKKLYQRHDYEGAMLKYEKAIKLLPKNHIDVAFLRTNLASCYMQMGIGEYPKAINECNLALEVAPKYSKALLKRAKCYESLNRLDLALRDVNHVLSIEPNNLTALEISEQIKNEMEEKGLVLEDKEIVQAPEYVEPPDTSSASKRFAVTCGVGKGVEVCGNSVVVAFTGDNGGRRLRFRPRGHSHPQGRDLARDLLRSFQYVFAYRELGYMATLTAMYSAMSF